MYVLKLIVLYTAKLFGLFHLSRRLTRKGLRIICYHGVEMDDESSFRPSLFMSSKKFSRRMEYLSRKKYPVLDLACGVELLKGDHLPDNAVVITFDDGWCGFYDKALEVLQKKLYPVTVYVTTYYCVKREPIFSLFVQYVFWKTQTKRIDLGMLGGEQGKIVDLTIPEKREHAIYIINGLYELMDESKREQLAEKLCELLELDIDQLRRKEIMCLMSPQQVKEIADQGVDIQLHTHRHRFSENPGLAKDEITDNKNVLEPLLGKELTHFCYPSGFWRKEHWDMLRASGIQSATTCDPGFNYKDTPELALNRFLDGEHIRQIQFEAEVSGFNEFLRAGRRLFVR